MMGLFMIRLADLLVFKLESVAPICWRVGNTRALVDCNHFKSFR